jgi:predicted RecB family endonuclease
MKSNEQYKLATQKLGMEQQKSSVSASQSGELAELYKDLSEAKNEDQRNSINAVISQKENEFEQEIDAINQKIYKVAAQENAIELEVKRLDTMVTALQKQLEAVEEAEGAAIDRATPKFNGVG